MSLGAVRRSARSSSSTTGRSWLGLLVCVLLTTPAAGEAAVKAASERRRGGRLVSKYYASVALAGAVSSSATHTLVVPLDVIKTAVQSNPGLGGTRAAIASLAGSGTRPLAQVGAFFNGVGATSAGYWMQGAIKFSGYELMKCKLKAGLRDSGERGAELTQRLQLPIMLLSAGTAEVVASLALCPFEVVKLRMQTSPSLASLGFCGALGSLAASEGVGTFFKGFLPIAMRQVPYTACKLVSFEIGLNCLTRAAASSQFRAVASSGQQQQQQEHVLDDRTRTAIVLASGLMAGAAAATVSQPFDLLLTRLCGSTAVATLSECVIAEGVVAQCAYLLSLGKQAFAGLGPRVAMISVMTSCQFVLYDSIRTSLQCQRPPE